MTLQRRLLEKTLTEAVKLFMEAGEMPPAPAPTPEPAPVDTGTPPPAQPPVPDQVPPEQDKEKPLDVDTLIGQLNSVRGGRSFSDPDVYKQLTAYYATIQPEDRVILDRILKGITDVVTAPAPQQPEQPPGGEIPPSSSGTPQPVPPTAPPAAPPPAPIQPTA